MSRAQEHRPALGGDAFAKSDGLNATESQIRAPVFSGMRVPRSMPEPCSRIASASLARLSLTGPPS